MSAPARRRGRPRALDDNAIAAIRRGRRDGVPVTVLADMYEVHVQTIYRYISSDPQEPAA